MDSTYLMTDIDVAKFVVNGYHLLELDVPDGLNEHIAEQLDYLDSNPGDAITDVVPSQLPTASVVGELLAA